MIKIFTIISLTISSFALDLTAYNKSFKLNTEANPPRIFKNERFNYHYKCANNINLTKNGFAKKGDSVAYSSKNNGADGISFLRPDGTIYFLPKDKEKLGSTKVRFSIGEDKYFAYEASSGMWMLGLGTPTETGYKDINISEIPSDTEQLQSYDQQITLAFEKLAQKTIKNEKDVLTESQLINCPKYAGKSGNKDFEISLSQIAKVETAIQKRKIASEAEKLLPRESLGGSEGGTGEGTSGRSNLAR